MLNNYNKLTISLTLIFGLITALGWYLPDIELKSKFLITGILVLAFVIIIFKKYIFKFWKYIVTLILVFISLYTIYKLNTDIFYPSLIIILSNIGIIIIFSFRNENINIIKMDGSKIFYDKKFSNWKINHWGTSYCKVKEDGIHFSGKGEKEEDGAHIDLMDSLKIGKEYKVECYAKSIVRTTGSIQIWCHDKIDKSISNGESSKSDKVTPSKNGQVISMTFTAKYNNNLRCHLQYFPGDGDITVEWLKIKRNR